MTANRQMLLVRAGLASLCPGLARGTGRSPGAAVPLVITAYAQLLPGNNPTKEVRTLLNHVLGILPGGCAARGGACGLEKEPAGGRQARRNSRLLARGGFPSSLVLRLDARSRRDGVGLDEDNSSTGNPGRLAAVHGPVAALVRGSRMGGGLACGVATASDASRAFRSLASGGRRACGCSGGLACLHARGQRSRGGQARCHGETVTLWRLGVLHRGACRQGQEGSTRLEGQTVGGHQSAVFPAIARCACGGVPVGVAMVHEASSSLGFVTVSRQEWTPAQDLGAGTGLRAGDRRQRDPGASDGGAADSALP